MKKPVITDITMTLMEPMPGFVKRAAKSIKKDGWNASTVEIYSHAGTHMDAPLHFEVSDTTIDQIPPNRFICHCHIVRLAPAMPGLQITLQHLEKINRRIIPGEGIIFHTGWSRYKDNIEIYRNRLPGISRELAQWVADKKINLVAVEPPSIADVNNLEELQAVHRILLSAEVLILEGICNLDSVLKDYVQLIALPLKIGGGDGAPVRALIIED